MTDQVVAMISPEHASKLVWNSAEEDAMDIEDEEEDSDRLVVFEVKKTVEQEETVSVRLGYEVCYRHLLH